MILRVLFFLLLCLFCFRNTNAQYDQYWAFGQHAGLDFSYNPPRVVVTSISTREGSASVSDENGRLLFYTDGHTVWDVMHQVMPNGQDLVGISTNVTTSTTQGTLIVPVPASSSQYYVFSLGSVESGFAGRLFYAIVDMNLNNGRGDVVQQHKAKLLAQGLSEQLTAVTGANCNMWLLTSTTKDPQIKVYNISNDGIDTIPVISPRVGVGDDAFSAGGSMDVSPDRSKLASAQGTALVLYAFDIATGKASKGIVIDSVRNMGYYGVAFAPGSSKLYASNLSSLFQYDVSQYDLPRIKASRAQIGNDQIKDCAIKRGPDNKVYIATNSEYLHVITAPDLPAPDCGYRANGLSLGGMNSILGLPNVAMMVRNKKFYRSVTDTILCADSFILSALDATGMRYIWNDGSRGTTFIGVQSGTFWVTYQKVGDHCEEYVDTFHVVFTSNQYDAATITLEGMCAADTLLLTARVSTANGYIWEDQYQGREKVVRSPGVFWLKYSDSATCYHYTDTFKVQYPSEDPKPYISLDTLACVDQEIIFDNQSSPVYNDFLWRFGDGNSSAVKNPKYRYKQAGTYKIQLWASVHGRCLDSITHIITVDTPVQVSFAMDQDSICTGTAVQFHPQVSDLTLELEWQWGEEGLRTSDRSSLSHAFDKPGVYPILLNGYQRVCPNTSYVDTVVVFAPPMVQLVADETLCWKGQPMVLRHVTDTMNATYSYLWQTGDTTSTIKAFHHGLYTLSITDFRTGCKGSGTIVVAKNCYTDMPNAFTPNGDGFNDYFYPRQNLSRGITSLHFRILNRWGQTVFESKATEGRGWDGRNNGQEQDAGVYIYTLEASYIDGRRENYSGNVSLLR